MLKTHKLVQCGIILLEKLRLHYNDNFCDSFKVHWSTPTAVQTGGWLKTVR